MAYVAYIDGKGKSSTDMVQKIGRFVRQPDAKPFEDPDLNSAYFYFNVPDNEFESLIRNMQQEMTVEGYELIAVKVEARPRSSEEVPAKSAITIPDFGAFFGENIDRLNKILTDNVPLYADDALNAKGRAETRVFNIGTLSEDERLRRIEERAASESTSVYDFLMAQLRAIDTRITPDIFHGTLRKERRLAQQVQYGSEAMRDLQDRARQIRDRLSDEFRLAWKGRNAPYHIKPFTMSSPNITGVAELVRERYRVRHYDNAVHERYNGLNPFEDQLANALDRLGKTWCRNPSRTGYGIPITELGADVNTFYPDFLLWTDNTIWAIDPKGTHLVNAAVQTKLYDVSDVSGGSQPVRVALILEGKFIISPQGQFIKQDSKQGCTLVRRVGSQVRTQTFDGLDALAKTLD